MIDIFKIFLWGILKELPANHCGPIGQHLSADNFEIPDWKILKILIIHLKTSCLVPVKTIYLEIFFSLVLGTLISMFWVI